MSVPTSRPTTISVYVHSSWLLPASSPITGSNTISLFVFRNEGLAWPHADTIDVGSTHVRVTTIDGFNLVFWEARGLGHVLVSDVSTDELIRLTSNLTR